MIHDSNNKPVIYESPDKGHTVYARVSGETHRTKISESQEAKTLRQNVQDSQLWYDIRRAAETNPVLKDMLEQVCVYYRLTEKSI
jgi:hypothetical protein